jgi:hypothetical protein
MVALEDRLDEDLGHSAKVDGHDCGSGETNIFIFTSDPAATFWKVRQTLQQEGRLEAVTVALRGFWRAEASGISRPALMPSLNYASECPTTG